MAITLTSLLTALFFSSIFIVLLGYLFHRSNLVIHVGTKIIFICVGFLFLRMLIPYEFVFTKSIRLSYLYPYITKFFWTKLTWVPLADFRVYHIFQIIWVVGAIGSIVRLIINHLTMKQILRVVEEVHSPKLDEMISFINGQNNCNKKIRIMQVEKLPTPFITGLLKPTIIIPKGDFDDPHLYYAILHEMTHLYNRDLWKKQFFAVLCALFWWNPCVWILSNIFNKTIELNTDYTLTKDMSEAEVYSYLECLIVTSKKALKSPKTSLAFANKNISALQQRFEFILECRKEVKRTSYKVVTIMFALIMLALSFTIIIEPSLKSMQYNEMESGIILDDKNVYLVEKNGGYDVYSNDQKVGMIKEIDNIHRVYPVYKSESEALK